MTTSLDCTVNGDPITATIDERTHLADFLREDLLLTATHLGCEHGVCGACTLLLDGEPVRSCLTLAALCSGRAIQTLEGLAEDPAMAALRDAFTAEHALQCGYCTPGMLVTARDIVLRLRQATDDDIRLELSGNLCRCTGYNGIVKAIRRVLNAQADGSLVVTAPLRLAPIPAAPTIATATPETPATPPKAAVLTQSLRIGLPTDTVWSAIQDPAMVAGCVPGARLSSIDGERIEGEMLASLGPIQARFTGTAILRFNQAARSGHLLGDGRDARTGTRLSADVTFTVQPDGANATLIRLDIVYALRGALAQFSRGAIVQVFAAEIAATVAANLEARLKGNALPEPEARLSGGRLILRVLWRALRRLLNIDHARP